MAESTFLRQRLYIDVSDSAVTDVSAYMQEHETYFLVEDHTGPLGYQELFKQLAVFEEGRPYTSTKNEHVQARQIKVLLPRTFAEENAAALAKKFMKELMNGNEILPYAAWIVPQGEGRYIHFLISERYYSPELKTVQICFKKPRYRNKQTGKLCKESDPGAVMFVKAGDVKAEFESHWSMKTRLFSADAFAEKSADKQERIGFDRWMDHLYEILDAVLRKLQAIVTKLISIPKIKRKDGNARYIQANIMKINAAIIRIENGLQRLYYCIYDGYFYENSTPQGTTVSEEFTKFCRRWIQKVQTRSFKYNKFILKISPLMRCSILKDNVNALDEAFEQELTGFYNKYIFD